MAKEFRVGGNTGVKELRTAVPLCKCKKCVAPVTPPAPTTQVAAQSTNIVPSPAHDALENALRKHRDSNTVTRDQALSEALTTAITPIKETK